MAQTVESPTEVSALLDFVCSLPAQDFDKGLQRFYAAQELLLSLMSRGEWPERPSEFRTLLSPIFCSNAEQQREFYQAFDSWAREHAKTEGRAWIPPPSPDAPIAPKRRIRRVAWVAIAVLLLVAVGFLVRRDWRNRHPEPDQTKTAREIVPTGPGNAAGAPVISSPAKMVRLSVRFLAPNGAPVQGAGILINGSAAISGDNGIAAVNVPVGVRSRYLVTHANFNSVLADYPGSGPLTVPLVPSGSAPEPPPPQSPWYILHRDVIRGVVASLPFVVLAGWWAFIILRRLRLRKWDAKPVAGSIKLAGAAGLGDVIPKEVLREIAREMCRRVPHASRKIAATPTAIATAKNADYFTPVYARVNSPQEYIVLIENRGAKDQQAQFVTGLMALLESNGAYLTAYFYTGDPRVCSEVAAPFQIVSLEEVIARHQGHALWIFGDVRPFVDGVTGEPAAWVQRLSVWHRRYIFDSGGPESLRELMLASGFRVLPLDLAAIRTSVKVSLEDGETVVESIEGGGLPAALVRDLRPLFSAEPPNGDNVHTVLSPVRRFLGPDAYECFCACALLPQLSFHITLALAHKIAGGQQAYAALQKITRTPWMRYGFMPDWLRKRLIRRLPPDTLTSALACIKAYLETARPVAVNEGRKGAPWIECSRPASRSKLPGALRDFIYLGALWGLKQDELAFSSPARLSRLLFRRGYAMFGLQPWVHLALAAAASAFLWLGATRATTPPATHSVYEDPFLRRVREVAQSQIGKKPDKALWRSPFADWAVDQAAQLLGQPTTLLTASFAPRGMPEVSDPNVSIGIGKPAWFALDASHTITAWKGMVHSASEGKPDPQTRYIDIRPSAQLPRRVAVFSTSAKVTFAQLQRFAAAAQKVIDGPLHQFWGVRATIAAYSRAGDVPADAWTAEALDALPPGEAGVHFDQNGKPIAQFLAQPGNDWENTASHEIFEMLVDPFGTRLIRGVSFDGRIEDVLHLAEICNPVEAAGNAKNVDGVLISDFVTPRWFFDPAALPGVPYDWNSSISGPRQIVNGGYSSFWNPANNQWMQRLLISDKPVDNNLGVIDMGFAAVRAVELPPGNASRGQPGRAILKTAAKNPQLQPKVMLIVPYPGVEAQANLTKSLEAAGYVVELNTQAANHAPATGTIDYFFPADAKAAAEVELIARKSGWKGSRAALDSSRNLGHVIQVWFAGN